MLPDWYFSSYPYYINYYPNSFGTAHSMAITPAAFCDGSVRNLKSQYLPAAVLGIDDGQVVPSWSND